VWNRVLLEKLKVAYLVRNFVSSWTPRFHFHPSRSPPTLLHVACTRDIRNTYIILARKLERIHYVEKQGRVYQSMKREKMK
jgi:hypothetical protein